LIVVDASALLEFLLQTLRGEGVEARLFREDDELHAPHLVDVEFTQGLRRLVRTGEVAHAVPTKRLPISPTSISTVTRTWIC
jgi:predicted nucleic acid-binding protein